MDERFLPELPQETILSFSALEIPLKQPVVFLFRHGERPLDQLAHDVQLTEEGALQSIEFGKFLRNSGVDPGVFLSSPYKRCQETLHYIIEGWGIDSKKYPVLDEIKLGHARYDTMKEIVHKTLKISTKTSNNYNQLHLLCSHDLMIGDCIRELFPKLVRSKADSLPGFLEGILWSKDFAIWKGNKITL
uniref:Histidine phosphatase family protein n=1 Tax=Acrobeloides nanus TaxID=290746 RepID=A0A914CYE3_9BILA